MKDYRKFVLVCDNFPPAGMGYAQRVGKLCKYLPRVSDWLPYVFCGTPTSEITGEDLELAKEIPKEVKVIRVKTFEADLIHKKFRSEKLRKIALSIVKLYSFPDHKINWARNLVKTAIKTYPDGGGFEVVLASGPPKSSYIAGYWLANYWKIPLVVDMRDPWDPYYLSRKYSPIHSSMSKRWEARIYKFSSKIIANTERNREVLLKEYPWLGDKVESIPNGYDPDDMNPSIGPSLKQKMMGNLVNSTIDLLYLGGVRGRVPGRLIFEEPFLKIVHEAIQYNRNLGEIIRIHFVGSDGKPLVGLIKKFAIENNCIFHGKVCCNQVGRPLAEADACVLILNSAAEGSGWIPAKTYYYLASGKPIIAISPECGLVDFLRSRATCFEVIHPYDKNGWRKFVSFLEIIKNIDSTRFSIDRYSEFTRKNIALRIARLLGEVSKSSERWQVKI